MFSPWPDQIPELTTIPNRDGLLALTHFLNKRVVLQPSTHTLVRLAELVPFYRFSPG